MNLNGKVMDMYQPANLPHALNRLEHALEPRYCIIVVLFENLVGCSSILRRRMRPSKRTPLAFRINYRGVVTLILHDIEL